MLTLSVVYKDTNAVEIKLSVVYRNTAAVLITPSVEHIEGHSLSSGVVELILPGTREAALDPAVGPQPVDDLGQVVGESALLLGGPRQGEELAGVVLQEDERRKALHHRTTGSERTGTHTARRGEVQRGSAVCNANRR